VEGEMNIKGKWRLLIIEPDASRLIIRDDDSFICEITQRDDGMSNAHLLVAAPELYGALKAIKEWDIHQSCFEMPDELIIKASIALNKADGK